MRVRATTYQEKAPLEKSFGEGSSVCDDLALVILEFGFQSLLERDGLRGDAVNTASAAKTAMYALT